MLPLSGRPRLLDDETFRRLCRARDDLADGFQRPLTLADAAASACLSPFHFQRLFRQTFGETPHAFLTRRRLDAAKALLAAGGLSVTEICYEVGYGSLGSFSALFSKRVGCPPSRYRRVVAVPALFVPAAIPACFLKHFGGRAA